MLGLALVVGALGWFLLGRDAPTPDPGPEEAADSGPPVVDAATLAARGPAEARAPVAIEGRIRAVVLGSDGAPVAGVRVVARHTGPAFDPEDPKAWYGGMDADQRARKSWSGNGGGAQY